MRNKILIGLAIIAFTVVFITGMAVDPPMELLIACGISTCYLGLFAKANEERIVRWANDMHEKSR